MEKYDYYKAVKEDIRIHLFDNYTTEELKEKLQDRDEFEMNLNDDLWICDSVTGNASGSYYCNAWRAEEAICHNLDLLGEALEEFGCGPEYMMKNGAEACDVTIRCYVLACCIASELDALEKEFTTEE